MGFTGSEIERLSGGLWAESSVRVYARLGGGRVKRVEKDHLIDSLRKLALSGKGVEDVDHVLELENSVAMKGSSVEEVAVLDRLLGEIGVGLGEVSEFVEASRGMRDEELSPANVKAWIKADKQMTEEGLDRGVRRLLFNGSAKYGGLSVLIGRVIMQRKNEDLATANAEMEEIYEGFKLRSDIEELRLEKYEKANESVATLLERGWELPVLEALPGVIRMSDSPEMFREAVDKCRLISELNTKIDLLSKQKNQYMDEVNALSDPTSRLMLDKVVALAMDPPPKNFDPKPLRRLALRVFRNYIDGMAKDPYTTEEEKKIMEDLRPVVEKLERTTAPV